MSRQYDAKHEVLKAYPDDADAGVELFLTILGATAADFEYEEGQSPVKYIYGEPQRISRDRDIILEAINDYDGWMLDDDYDAFPILERIIQRMKQRIA